MLNNLKTSSTWPSNYRLSPWIRLLAGFCNIIFGIIPGLIVFFVWVERNCNLQFGYLQYWNFPRIDLSPSTMIVKCFWNITLFLLFGFFHSALAQKPIQKQIERVLPPQLIRTFYLCVTGISLTGVMTQWQPTHQMIWKISALSTPLWQGVFFVVYWILMLGCGRLLTRFGTLEFFGLKQHRLATYEIYRTEGTPQLIITGMYRWVRHPVYTGTLLAFLVTPEMTLDRCLVVLTTLIYLQFGIPLEEKKLIRQFGKVYIDYQRKVPALIPKWKKVE